MNILISTIFVLLLWTFPLNTFATVNNIPNLSSYWKFDENTGINAYDSSRNGNKGVLENGTTWTTGKMRSGVSLDGNNDRILIKTSKSLNDKSTITITGWIYPNRYGGTILSKSSLSADSFSILLDDLGLFTLAVRYLLQTGVWKTEKPFVLNTWQHFAVTYNSKDAIGAPEVYINGIQKKINEVKAPEGSPAIDDQVMIIGNNAQSTSGYSGIIDNFRIYDRLLSENEVQALYDFDSAERPNIIVIMTDDQRDGSSMHIMENVKNLLSKNGITFTNSFVENPRCCPARTTFVTGQYCHNSGIYANGDKVVNGVTYIGSYAGLISTDGNTLPVWLQEAGYHTAMIGKYINGYSNHGRSPSTYVPPGWDRWFARGETVGTRYFNYTIDDQGVLKKFGDAKSDYLNDVYLNEIISFLKYNTSSQQPFFLFFGPSAPHGEVHKRSNGTLYMKPPVPAPRHDGLLSDMIMPKDPSFNEADVSDKPSYWAKTYPLMNQEDIVKVEIDFRKRLESLLSVDEAVKKIVDEIKNMGKLDETVIIFTSDNGYFLGEHRRPEGKDLVYETSIRVPLIISGKGIPKNEKRSHLINNVDLPATIVELAKANPGRMLDGRSIIKIIKEPETQWRSTLLFQEFLTWWYKPIFGLYHAVRTDHFKYVENEIEGGGFEYELYDLNIDPYELESKHNNPLYTVIKKNMEARLKALKGCKGDSCWMTNPEPTSPYRD